MFSHWTKFWYIKKAYDKHTFNSRIKCTSESNVVTRQIHMHTLTNTHTHMHITHTHTHEQTIQKPQEGKSGLRESSARGNIESCTKKCMHSRCNSLFLLLAAPFHISLQYVQFAFTHIYCFQHLIYQIISVLLLFLQFFAEWTLFQPRRRRLCACWRHIVFLCTSIYQSI